MEVEQFKEQQQDRVEEGKELKREDELKDLSQIPKKEIPGAQSSSLLSKISDSISHAATTITDKVGFKDITVEGHEDLDKDVRKQVKKVNKEILHQAEREGQGPEKVSEWAHELPKHAVQKAEGAKDQAEGLVRKISNTVDEIKDSGNLSSGTTIQPNREGPSPLDKVNEQYSNIASKVEETVSVDSAKQSTSILGAIQQGIHGVTDKISQGVESFKRRFSGDKAEEREDDGTKNFRDVKKEDAINETVTELKHDKRVEELGQEKLTSKNPFDTLSTGNQDESETRTFGEKVKGSINDTSAKISSKVGEVSQKVKSTFSHSQNAPVDKENVQQAS